MISIKTGTKLTGILSWLHKTPNFLMYKIINCVNLRLDKINWINLPSSLTRCPVAKSWEMTSGGKVLPQDEIDVAVVVFVVGWMVILSESQDEKENYKWSIGISQHNLLKALFLPLIKSMMVNWWRLKYFAKFA